MWSEEWDKKLREAAGQENHPADPEKGWQQMEPLLDKHLPQDRRRKRFFFLVFLLGTISAAVYFYSAAWQLPASPAKNKPGITTAGAKQENAIPETGTVSPEPVNKKEDVVNNKTAVPFIIDQQSDQPRKNHNPQPGGAIVKTSERKMPGESPGTSGQDAVALKSTPSALPAGNISEVLPSLAQQNPESFRVVSARYPPENISKEHTSVEDADPASHETTPANDSAAHPSPREESVKQPPAAKSRWGISLMTSADISGVRPSKPGEWRAAYGAGISYAINNRWTIRAGFMRSRKVYSAAGSDYNPPKRFWNYVSELDHVNANCLVYEIPLNVQYFFPGRKGDWFASAGLHSFLMKNETYYYDYKDMSGQERYMSQSYKNYSTHFPGVLNLSGGYRFNIIKKIKISAEPYVQLPLGGVGYGKVKLYSGGMLFSATIGR